MGRIYPDDYVERVSGSGNIGRDALEFLINDDPNFLESYEEDIINMIESALEELKRGDDETQEVIKNVLIAQKFDLHKKLDELIRECDEKRMNNEGMTQELADRIKRALDTPLISRSDFIPISNDLSPDLFKSYSNKTSIAGAGGYIDQYTFLIHGLIEIKNSLIKLGMPEFGVRLWELSCALEKRGLGVSCDKIKKIMDQVTLAIEGRRYVTTQVNTGISKLK